MSEQTKTNWNAFMRGQQIGWTRPSKRTRPLCVSEVRHDGEKFVDGEGRAIKKDDSGAWAYI